MCNRRADEQLLQESLTRQRRAIAALYNGHPARTVPPVSAQAAPADAMLPSSAPSPVGQGSIGAASSVPSQPAAPLAAGMPRRRGPLDTPGEAVEVSRHEAHTAHAHATRELMAVRASHAPTPGALRGSPERHRRGTEVAALIRAVRASSDLLERRLEVGVIRPETESKPPTATSAAAPVATRPATTTRAASAAPAAPGGRRAADRGRVATSSSKAATTGPRSSHREHDAGKVVQQGNVSTRRHPTTTSASLAARRR